MGLHVSCDGGGYFSPARDLALLKGVIAEGAFCSSASGAQCPRYGKGRCTCSFLFGDMFSKLKGLLSGPQPPAAAKGTSASSEQAPAPAPAKVLCPCVCALVIIWFCVYKEKAALKIRHDICEDRQLLRGH